MQSYAEHDTVIAFLSDCRWSFCLSQASIVCKVSEMTTKQLVPCGSLENLVFPRQRTWLNSSDVTVTPVGCQIQVG